MLHKAITWRRGVYTAGFALAYSTLLGTVSFARWLDSVLYPKFRKTPIPSPLFVVATPRSGTTYLHHLLSLDDERFVSFKLYQTVAPSIVLDRMIDQLHALDKQTELGLSLLLDAVDRRMFTDWDEIHRVGLRAFEEDENLFVYALASPALYLLFPFVRELPELADVRSFGSAAVQRLAREYRESVQRLLYVCPGARTPLLKTVLLPSRLEVAETAFPDARYIHVIRDPRQAIPSAVSMFHTMWRSHSPAIAQNSDDTRALAHMFVDHYRRLAEQRRSLPAERVVTVRYEALVEDPVASIGRIYRRLGMPVSERFLARVQHAARTAADFKSRHRYQLEQFGLSAQDLGLALEEYRADLAR
jgi:LPS sulfotransferase NodH